MDNSTAQTQPPKSGLIKRASLGLMNIVISKRTLSIAAKNIYSATTRGRDLAKFIWKSYIKYKPLKPVQCSAESEFRSLAYKYGVIIFITLFLTVLTLIVLIVSSVNYFHENTFFISGLQFLHSFTVTSVFVPCAIGRITVKYLSIQRPDLFEKMRISAIKRSRV